MEKTRKYYQELVAVKKDYNVMLKNFISAFTFGGGLAILGQLIFDLYHKLLHINPTDSALYMTLTMVFLSGILTAFGIYDKLGKCGLAIPITGFANASVSSAMEYHKEGIVLGIGSNTLKLAGSVIVLGTVSALLVASIRYIIEVLL